ncbi:hypothetical protein FIV32_02385 [Sphingomonadales bacterium 58]|uniref:hypothetical protein n=1 Tax=Sphingobium sp. S8 TaxID=2758385 RepID=UPI00191B3619|nr:hypothetical protein [Sphingobium sp. S8]MBY2957597.1 hypothetical protein [Sphingomonadales bacterium 58]CAD7335405.1 hypothetical protein SPHS8_00491 [Sphingobium sp. S8]
MIAAAYFKDGMMTRVIGVPDYPSLIASTEEGEVGYEIPLIAAQALPINLEVVRAFYHARIDQQAGACRSHFITSVPGQAQTYQRKEAEARAWTEGDEVANPDHYPFMLAEASVRGVTVAQVRDEIMEQVNQLVPLAAMIEAKRIHAKRLVDAAEDIPGIAGAAAVEWLA